jgi:hypothetical protein
MIGDKTAGLCEVLQWRKEGESMVDEKKNYEQ